MEIIKQRKAGQQSGSGQEAEQEKPLRKLKRKQQDIAGSLKADRQNLRTAELEQLFQVWIFPEKVLNITPAADWARYCNL